VRIGRPVGGLAVHLANQRGILRQVLDVGAQLAPGQIRATLLVSGVEGTETDPVAPAEIGLDRGAVLRYEGSESCDSPALIPQYSSYAFHSALVL
jgi:hypothetical protein